MEEKHKKYGPLDLDKHLQQYLIILHTSNFGYENIGVLAENSVFVHLLKKSGKVN